MNKLRVYIKERLPFTNIVLIEYRGPNYVVGVKFNDGENECWTTFEKGNKEEAPFLDTFIQHIISKGNLLC